MCAGDSITGWNNFGPANLWPYPTYPQFLQQLSEPSGLRIADGGIAGEVSDNGLSHVKSYLDLFPNALYFIIGPEKQFESFEEYLRTVEGKGTVHRLYPRDYWIVESAMN